MKQRITRFTVGLGCLLFATSGCAVVQATSEIFNCVAGTVVVSATYATQCPMALLDTMALFGNTTRDPATADPDSTIDTPSTVILGGKEPMRHSPYPAARRKLRATESYFMTPPPTPGDTPTQPESPLIPLPH